MVRMRNILRAVREIGLIAAAVVLLFASFWTAAGVVYAALMGELPAVFFGVITAGAFVYSTVVVGRWIADEFD